MKGNITNTASILAMAAMVSLFAVAPAAAEYLFIKDGSIVEGKIVNESKADITLAVKSGGSKTYNRDDVMRTLYRNEFLYRQSMKLYSGEAFDCFIVHEDRVSYVVRKDLFSPRERTVRKVEIVNLQKKELYSMQGKKLKEYSTLGFVPVLAFRGTFMYPFLEMQKLFRYGYGGQLGFEFAEIRQTHWGIGIEGGYWQMLGKSSVKDSFMVPMTARLYYAIPATNWFSIALVVSGGCVYSRMSYSYYPRYNFVIPSKNKKHIVAFKPVATAGLNFIFLPVKKFAITIEAYYGFFIERKGLMHYVSISPGCQVRF